MIPRLVTFDCAGTLVAVPQGWSMGGFAADCARHVGLCPTEADAAEYQRLYMSRLPEFVEANMSRDPGQRKDYWRRLATDWLASTGQTADALDPMLEAADELGFGANSILFSLYDDVVPCLDALDALGVRASVVSNWDYSLHRVLRMFGIEDRFVTVTASLEEGVEKPDPKLFEITLRRAGFETGETLHVGDDLVDDVQGAVNAGIRPVLLDRSLTHSERPAIRSLLDLPEALGWID